MRIVIDAQCIASSALATPAPVLAILQSLIRLGSKHQIVLALHQQHCESVESWQQAFAPAPANLTIAVYSAPRGAAPWQEAAASLLHDEFLARFAPDFIVVPEAMAAGAPTPLGEIGADVATIFMLSAQTALPTDGSAENAAEIERRLRQAAHWSCDAAVTRAAWESRVWDKPALALPAAPDAVAARLWESIDAMPAPAAIASAAKPGAKPRMAYLSPLPPEKSGVADYSLELVQVLKQYYAIDLIVAHTSQVDSQLSAQFAIHDIAWFEANHAEFDRILYQIGNSHMHQHMFELIKRYPGVIVLHDFFLSNILHEMEGTGVLPQAFLHALYESHGYTGLSTNRLEGRVPTVWKYPCNKAVLDNADGVIVHSEFSRELANRWYGDNTSRKWQALPLIRGRNKHHVEKRSRTELREALGIGADDFVIASFGLLGVTKLNDRLLEAFLDSPLAQNPRCRLVFVGENSPTAVGAELAGRIATSEARSRITITGFVTAGDYAAYLNLSDIAVQLRAQSRGESSAAILDCLLYGLPTIVNAHGSAAALPNDALIKLNDEFATAELSDALVRLYDDASLRASLSERALTYIAREHAPEQVGQRFYAAIEQLSLESSQRRERTLLKSLKQIDADQPPVAIELVNIAAAIAANRVPTSPRQLMVDVSAMAQTDLRTGIQRVVRSIVLALIENPPPGFRIEPVYTVAGAGCYRYARRFTSNMIGEHELVLEDDPVEVRADDIFIGLDLHAHATITNQALLAAMRKAGMQVHFVIFDILPLLRPASFPFGTDEGFSQYIDTVATLSDGLICISRAVADELRGWLGRHPMQRATPLSIGYFHLGADIDASAPTRGLPANVDQIMAALSSRPTFLMVGTVEPRKGHAQALGALDLLWKSGADVNLVVVGKRGWMVDAVAKAMEEHKELNHRLFWLQGVSDEMLLKLYESSSALLATSLGEGFGLPLIEAAQHQLPIIARRLPVFEEVSGQHAFYFEGEQVDQLKAALDEWLVLFHQQRAPSSQAMPWLTWAESAQQLLDVAVGGNWYASAQAESLAPMAKVA